MKNKKKEEEIISVKVNKLVDNLKLKVDKEKKLEEIILNKNKEIENLKLEFDKSKKQFQLKISQLTKIFTNNI